MNRPAPGSFRPRMPFHMVWLATNACNARCLHCSSNSTVRGADELNTDQALDLIDQLTDSGVVDLAISGGEPLLRKDILQIVCYARERGLAVGLGSNGAVLEPRRAALLAEAGIERFQVSLDGFHASHDTLRQWPGLFERVLKTIQVAQEAGLRVHVCCTINRLNATKIESFAAFISGLGVRRLNFSRYVPTGRGSDDLDLAPAEWREVIALCAGLRSRYKGSLDIVTHLAQQVMVDEEVADMPGFIGCQAGIGQGCVTANGTVQPCVLLPLPLGNVRQRRFREIWETSPVIRALQARDRLKGRCQHCALKDRCGGCRAVAFAQSGDPLESDPRCWLQEKQSVV